MSKVIIDEPGIYLTKEGKMALVFEFTDGSSYIAVLNGHVLNRITDKFGICSIEEGCIKEKIKGIDLYAAFNKVYGKKS